MKLGVSKIQHKIGVHVTYLEYYLKYVYFKIHFVTEDRFETERQRAVLLQGGPKKVSHYRQSSLNRIKNRKPG